MDSFNRVPDPFSGYMHSFNGIPVVVDPHIGKHKIQFNPIDKAIHIGTAVDLPSLIFDANLSDYDKTFLRAVKVEA